MIDAPPFASLTTLRAAHRQLLESRRTKNGDTAAYFQGIEQFIQRGRATGALLDNSGERWQAQNLIDYWVNELHQSRRELPEATLIQYDPSQAPTLDDALCPYLGLDTFGTSEHKYFFGRSQLIQQMVNHLKAHRFLAVVGPSGSGKSSAVLAGLIPELQDGALYESINWRYLTPLMPGTDPQANLVSTIWPDKEKGWSARTAERLLHDPAYLAARLSEESAEPAVLVIDQFEEVFTFCQDDERRRAFINTLLHLVQMPNTRHTVIITMRSDVESSLVQYPALEALYEQAIVRVTAMKATELREAIENPAKLVGLKFEDNLVEELVREILGDPAALPLLQFTLLKLWENREYNRVTWAAYQELGGGRQALANSADAFYNKLTERQREIGRSLLLHIVQPSIERQMTRDRVARQAIYDLRLPGRAIEDVLTEFINARLLRLIEGRIPAEDQIQIAHEALTRIWPRFVGWLEEARVAQRRRLRLVTTAEQWEAERQDERLLLRGLLLEEATRYSDLNPLEQNFVKASVTQINKEKVAQEQERQRQLEQAQALAEAQRRRAEESSEAATRLQRITMALVVMFAIAIGTAYWAISNGNAARENAAIANDNRLVAEEQRATAESSAATAVAIRSTAESSANLRATAEFEARQQQDVAELAFATAEAARLVAETSAAEADAARADAEANALEAEQQSRLATSRELAASAIDQLDSESQLGLLLAIEAVNITFDADGTVSAEAEAALFRALQASQRQFILSGHTDQVSDVAYSPDGALLATAGFDTSVKIWDTSTGQELFTLSEHGRVVNSVAFSPDGRFLASGGDDGFIIIWDVASGMRLTVFSGENGAIRDLAFSPDGRFLASANQDATVRLWDVPRRRSEFLLFGHAGALTAVAFSPDGTIFATGSEDGRIIFWNADTGSPLLPINPDREEDPIALTSLTFNPSGDALLAGYENGLARLYLVESTQLVATLSGHASAVTAVSFSRDGRFYATASTDGTSKVWTASTAEVAYTLSSRSGGVNAIAFDPTGNRITTANQDGNARVWNAASNSNGIVFTEHDAPLYAIAYTEDGRLAATAGEDEIAYVWDSETGLLLNSFTDHNNTITDVAFNPAGTKLATSSLDFNARLWDLESGEVQLPLLEHRGPVNSVQFSSDGEMVLTASDDKFARLWQVSNSAFINRFEHETAVKHATFSPDGQFIATATVDGNLHLWDLTTNSKINTFEGHEGIAQYVTFNPRGTQLVSASGDGTVRIWSMATGETVRTLSGHVGAVLVATFSPDGNRLVTVGVDRTVRIWNPSSGQLLRTLLNHTATVRDVAYSPNGRFLATASFDRTAQINPLQTIEELLVAAQERVTRSLTPEECRQFLRGLPCTATDN